jgi:anthranilate synthase component I
MFAQLTEGQFKTACHNQRRAIVYREFPCDDLTPIQAFLSLNAGEGAVLLESAVKDEELGRYSLLAIEPFATFSSEGVLEPLEGLREMLKTLSLPPNPSYPPIVGGCVGFITYDAIRLFEEVPNRHPVRDGIPDLLFLFHAVHIAFDHSKESLLISVNIELTGDDDRDYGFALQKIEEILLKMKSSPIKSEKKKVPDTSFSEEMSDAAFCQMVEKAKEHIVKGDAFQVVLSRTFSCPYSGNPFDVYRALRMTNPSPFMFYIQMADYAIAGASPERLVRLQGNKLQTMPIAGTRSRVIGEEERAVLELSQDPKEDAEHMMLVDLGRNDLGIVAKVGTVHVAQLKSPRYFPHVIHLVSQIEAQIAEGYDALDALKAVFPAGTLTGAPKISAMQIIDQLESSARGIYGGCICSIDNHGNLDSCIAIRTAFIKEGIASVRAGAGIVFDSDPQREAEETRAKAKGVIQAIQLAARGVL